MIATDTPTRLRAPRLARIAAVGGGLIGVAALAGCAPSAAGSTDSSAPAAAASSASSASAGTSSAGTSSAGTSSTGLKDGSYTATGHYQSPSGDSMVAVTVTLKGGTITAVKVLPKTADPTAQQYEKQFASGIGAVAVGKKIAGLQVGAVSGSSLTSQGFEKALAQIQTEAA